MKQFLLFGIALLVNSGSVFAVDTQADIEFKTTTSSPEVSTAHVGVRPAYYLDPDGRGVGPVTAKDDKLVGRWDFEESNSGGPYINRITKTVSGTTVAKPSLEKTGSSVSLITQGVSKSLNLGGSGYVSGILDAPNDVDDAGKFTLSFWFNINSTGTDYKTLFRMDDYFSTSQTVSKPFLIAYKKQPSGQQYITLRVYPLNAGGQLTDGIFAADATNASAITTAQFNLNFVVPSDLEDSKWHQLVVTYDRTVSTNSTNGGPFAVYLDSNSNRLQTANSVSYDYDPSQATCAAFWPSSTKDYGTLNQSKIYFGFGVDNPSGNYFKGYVDRARVYRSTLTSAEVATIFNQNIDGDGFIDMAEVNQGSDVLDPASPGVTVPLIDDQNLATATAAKIQLGKWDFETLTGAGNVQNLKSSTGNGDLTLGGAALDDGNAMPSRSVRFGGGAVMQNLSDLNWGAVSNYSSTFWVRFQEGGKLGTTSNRIVLWSLKNVFGANTRLLLTARINPSNSREIFELISVNSSGVSAAVWSADHIVGLTNGGWHHFGLVKSGASFSLYLDGALLGAPSNIGINSYWQGNNFSGTGVRLEVGGASSYLSGYTGLEGNIDRLRFWGESLNQTDITNLYLQDYDGDRIPDFTEIEDSSLNPLVADTPTGADANWDQAGISGTDVTTGLLAHWNFESFRYGTTGRYFENQKTTSTLPLYPNSGVVLSNSEGLASYFASFRGSGDAQVTLGSSLANKSAFAIAGWLKIDKDAIWELPGVPTPLWEIQNYQSGTQTTDSMKMYAIRLGQYTQVFLTNFDPATGVNGPNASRWLLPRDVRIDNEDWHHLVFQYKSGDYELYLDTKKLAKITVDGYPPVVAANFTNTNTTAAAGTLFRIGSSLIVGKQYGIKGGWDRIRIYTQALSYKSDGSSPSLIHALYRQDADLDGVSDLDELGIVGRSPIVSESGTVLPPGTDLTKVDIEGLPKSLSQDSKLLGLWDFENLPDRSTGFAELSGRGSPMIPSGSARDVGIDLGSGMPSRSVFAKNGGYVVSDAAQLSGCKEFSVSVWIKTQAGLIDQQPGGFSVISLEDLIGSGSSNTLTLRLQKTGASQSLIVQPFSTQSGFLKIGAGGAGWSLLDQRVDDGKWHHLTWIRRSSGSAIYVDGRFLDQPIGTGSEFVTTLAATSNVTPKLVLGRTSYRAPELAINGNLDRLRFYGRAIKPEEVQSLYGQDFDRDGYSDIEESQNFGFDPFHAPPSNDDGTAATDWDDDTGIAATEAVSLRSGLIAAWNFESIKSRVAGDNISALRFPTERVASLPDAVAEGGVQWDGQAGLLSKSLGLARDGYLKLPPQVLGSSGDKLTSSFWIRMAKDEISNQARELEVTGEKLALITLGENNASLPNFILSVDYSQQLIAETSFQRTYQPGSGFTRTELGRWHSPAKLDDGRWHHVVINLKSSGSDIYVDGFNSQLSSSSVGTYPGYNIGNTTGSYLWMGFRKNQLLDPSNILASQLPFRGFSGAVDRIRLYDRSITETEIQSLYAQDRDQDTIPDVTEVNSSLNPYIPDAVASTGDYDKDSLSNSEETTLGTIWWKPDSDGDWMSDGWEQKYNGIPDSFKPLINDRAKRNLDQDGDSLIGFQEFVLGTDPDKADTDGDLVSDGAEFFGGSNPLNIASVPLATAGGTDMTRNGVLPGGLYKANSGGGGDPSYSFNGQDATGPRYRKVSLNGRPIADQAPETDGETDHHEEETYVDSFSLGLHHDTSLIYVPVPASDLTLQVTMSLESENWSNRSGIRPLESLTSPFGSCWSSNICAYIEETTEVGGQPDTGATPSPKFNYSAIDEDGRTLRFGSYNGVSIFAYPSSLSDRKSYQHELKRSSDSTLVLKKKFGTTLTYEKVALDQAHFTNRAGECDSFQQHRYYRLVRVSDRYGNTISYTYPSSKTLIPSVIGVNDRPDLKMEITADPLDPHRVKSVKDPRGYIHQFSYTPLAIPNGALSATSSVNMLTSVTNPLGEITRYAYNAGYEGDYTSNPSQPTHYYSIDLSAITNRRGVTSTFAYEVDDDKYSSSLQSDGRKISRIYGLPRVIKTVRSAASAPAGLPGDSQAEQVAEFSRRPGLRWFYTEQGLTVTSGGNQFIATNEWSNDVKNAVGKVTTYTFRDINAVLADTDTHGSSLSLNWMIYYLEMDIIHPDSIGTEIYKFDLASGLSLIQSMDICGNSTFYHYNDSWGGFSLIPSILGRQAMFSKWSDPSDKIDALGRTESYAYSPNFRVMSSSIDVHGTRSETAVDEWGRRKSLVVTGADGIPLSQESFSYTDSRFPSFMTSNVKKAFQNLSGQTWEGDMTHLYQADSNGRIATEAVDMNRNGTIDAGDLKTTYTYDKNGNKISSTDARGAVTTFVYDPLGRIARVIYPPADGAARNESRSKITLFDANGNKHAEFDENGFATVRLYDALNRVVSQIRDMDGVSVPTSAGETNLEGQTYYRLTGEGAESIADLVTRFSYNDANSVLFKTDARGIMTATVYDAIERPISVWENFSTGDTEAMFATAGDKALTTFEYDKASNTGGSIFSGDGFKPTRTIKRKATLVSSGSSEDVIVTNAYDKVYRPISDTTQYEPGKTVTNLTSYNDTLYQSTKTVAAGTAYARVSFTQFDGLGRDVTSIDDYGTSRLNATSQKLYSATGLVYKTIDPLGRESESEYDAAGRAVKVWQASSDAAPGATGFGKVDRTTPTSQVAGSPLTVTEYDPNGNVVSVTNARGFTTLSSYDARNRKISEQQPAVDADGDPDTSPTAVPTQATFYDGVGNVIAQQNVRGHYSRSFYDRANRVIFTRTNPSNGNPSSAPSPTSNNAYDIVSISTYDKGGNVVALQDGNGNITRNKYDARNRLVITATDSADGSPTDPNGSGYSAATYQGAASSEIVVTNAYDDSGNLTQVTDGEGHKTGFRYDGLGRKTRTLWDVGAALQRVEQSEFNGVYQTARVDPKSQRTEYVYDGLYRNIQTNYIGRTTDNRVNTYDLAGNLLTVTYPNETTTGKTQRNCAQTYDGLNRLLTEVSAGQTHAYTYDKIGNRLTTTYQGGRYILSAYDALNRLQTASEKTSVSSTNAYRVTTYGYDLAGNILRKALPNGVTTFTTYDPLNRKLRMEDKLVSTSAILSSFDYSQSGASGLSSGYDNVGSLLKSQEIYTNSSVRNRIIYNTYDHVYRLTSETLDESGSGTDANVTVTTYGYDKANNRTSKAKQVNGVLAAADNLVFTFGNGVTGANSNQLTGYGPSGSAQTHTFSYDLNGNRAGHVFATRTDVYGYDYENRLVTFNFQTGVTSTLRGTYTYVYDHRTRRVARSEPSGGSTTTTNISFSGGTSVQERVGTSTTIARQYIRGSDWGGGVGGILYSFDSSVLTYNHYNSRGDVVSQTSGTGTVNWQAAYEAFGTRVREGGTAVARQKANTKDEDPTGLLDEGMRYRDLESGVFITRDPAGFVDGPNVYTYVRQNPWSGFDPDGLQSIHEKKWQAAASNEGNGTLGRIGASIMAAAEGMNPFRADSSIRDGNRSLQAGLIEANKNLDQTAPRGVRELGKFTLGVGNAGNLVSTLGGGGEVYDAAKRDGISTTAINIGTGIFDHAVDNPFMFIGELSVPSAVGKVVSGSKVLKSAPISGSVAKTVAFETTIELDQILVKAVDNSGTHLGGMASTIDRFSSSLHVDFVGVADKAKGMGIGTGLYKESLAAAGKVTEVLGEPSLDNLAALKKGGIGATPRAKILDKLGNWSHDYESSTNTMRSVRK